MASIGLGLAALGRPGYINLGHAQDLEGRRAEPALSLQTSKMLDLALELGVRYFDAARSYGRAENFLLRWIQQQKTLPSDFQVGSKWGYTYTANWEVQADQHEVKAHTLENFQRQWNYSRELLPYLKLYQVHSATLDSGILERTEIHRAMAQLKEQGVEIGLSLSGPAQAETLLRALEIEVDGQALFSSVQATYNLFERSVGPALQTAQAAGWQVIIKEALANGRLTSRNERPEDGDALQFLAQKASAYQTTIDALALAFILEKPWVDIVLSGAAQEDHLRSNLQAYSLVEVLDWSASEWEQMVEVPEAYWATRKGLAWN